MLGDRSLLKVPPDGINPSAAEIVAGARSGRAVLQDFCPLADSLEWELGQRYFRDRGNRAFISDAVPVPYVINNDGNLSTHVAEVLHASLHAAEQIGTLEAEIFVLELGLGVGLFARFFLDAFRQLCAEHGTDYYDRLCYVAGDYSESMLLDACRHGVFADHPGRYLLRVVDALCPERTLSADPLLAQPAGRPFRAVFLNYLLDCLPAAAFRVEGEEVRQLCVRTCLARGAEVSEYGGTSIEELARLATSTDPADRQELLRVFDLLGTEYDYRAADYNRVPYGDFAVQYARAAGNSSVLLNYGALQCLERLGNLLHEQGFILLNDYGSTQTDSADHFEHQRFSQATGIGLNFPLLKAYFTRGAPEQWAEPPEGPEASIHARLLGPQMAPATVARFRERFGQTIQDWLQEPVERARGWLQAGRFEAGLAAYQQALERQPYNWVLMNEVAHFLTFSLGNPTAGLEMAKAALARNPSCSADLWNMLGDSQFVLGRIEESRKAFLRALEVNADDVRARYNLAYVHARTREYPQALQRIAEALALDRAGHYREGLLQKQSEVLALLAQRYQEESQRMVNRVSTRPDLPRAGERPPTAGLADKSARNPESSKPMAAAPPLVAGADPGQR
jgi:tetratricopeptide (TPR) repeat protein